MSQMGEATTAGFARMELLLGLDPIGGVMALIIVALQLGHLLELTMASDGATLECRITMNHPMLREKSLMERLVIAGIAFELFASMQPQMTLV